jgi:hypothetical protein
MVIRMSRGMSQLETAWPVWFSYREFHAEPGIRRGALAARLTMG